MKKNTLLILLILLAAGIGAVLVLNNRAAHPSAETDYALPKFTVDEIDKIVITTGSDTLELVRSSTGWTIDGYQADEDTIRTLLESFAAAEVTGPVSTVAENYGAFDVDQDSGTELSLFSGDNEKLSVIIGKTGTTPGTVYFKPADRESVYTANQSWNGSVHTEVNDWRDKTVWSFGHGEVTKIIATDGGMTYEATSSEGTWQAVHDDQKAAVTGLDALLGNLEADGFVTDEKNLNGTLAFFRNEEKIAEFSVGQDDKNFYVQPSDSEAVFQITASKFSPVWLPDAFE